MHDSSRILCWIRGRGFISRKALVCRSKDTCRQRTTRNSRPTRNPPHVLLESRHDPQPRDWSTHFDVVRYFFLEDQDYEPEGVRFAGVCPLSAGWSKICGDTIPDNIYILGKHPARLAFTNNTVAAVCHHGVAGTTACGLWNGCPTIVVPFFGNQPWQGNIVQAARAGPTSRDCQNEKPV
jgi:hypothetical protein